MGRFILKAFVFLLPVMMMFGLTQTYYNTTKGDLIRMGYIKDPKQYQRANLFGDAYSLPVKFTLLSEIDLSRSHQYKVLTIGDSFSEQDNTGYKNYLAQSESVLHIDNFLHSNPIETLYGLLNGDVLDSIGVEYIILQSVERSIIYRALNIDSTKVLCRDTLARYIQQQKVAVTQVEKPRDLLFSKVLLDFTVNNIGYLVHDNPYHSDVYKVKTTRPLFSVDNQDVLFYSDDLNYLPMNNDSESVAILNRELNSLAKKLNVRGIKLIVLPCPDKYDLYYPYIANKTNYPQPKFFNLMENMPKEYVYLDAKQVLRGACEKRKDVYYYDDTHWSPVATKIIADKLRYMMTTQ